MDPKKKVAIKKPPVVKPVVKPKAVVKPKPVVKPKVIKLTDNKKDFKLENKAIYFAKLDSCYFCNQMMPEWEKAKQQLTRDTSINSNIKIYEIDGRYLNNYPLLQKRVVAFPTILRYNNGFTPFEQQRSAYNFSNFMKNG